MHDPDAGHRRDDFATRISAPAVSEIPGLDFADAFEDLG
ncbi:ATP-binding protein [Streptomyces violaceorubidus]